MPHPSRNIELKSRCLDLAVARDRAIRLGAKDAGVLRQRDTFFEAPHARLKLREFGDGRAELIAYQRPDRPDARGSDYFVCPVASPEVLAATLGFALAVTGKVAKTRHLFLYRATRIHLDEVEGLGAFVELETVLSGQPEPDARDELHAVAAALALDPADYVDRPYVDLAKT